MTNISFVHVSLEIWGCIFCIIAATCSFIERKIDAEGSRVLILIQLSAAMLLCSDALAWIFRGNVTTLGYYLVRISNFMVFSITHLLMVLITIYIASVNSEVNHKIDSILVRFIYMICIASWILLLVSQFTGLYYDFDATNHYYRKDMFWISQVSGIIGMVIDAVLIFRKRNYISRLKFIAMLSYVVLPIAALIIQIFVYGIAFLNISITVAVLLMFAEYLVERSKRIVKQERELNQAKVDILLSQIKPHFLFNSLTTIRHLCKKDTGAAIETIDEFSAFLRDCTDSLNRKTMISFHKEMEIVNHYLYLEKKRFGSRLNVICDIQAEYFEVPAFSIQPIVENAVKHGLMEKLEGGTVSITAFEKQADFVIRIMDDGVGFDPKVTDVSIDTGDEDRKRTHVGLENVRSRLKLMCGGRMQIESTPGEGTKVSIQIPKQ